MPATIFVLEDDTAIREDLVELLTMEGYAVEAFVNGKEGLEGLRAAPAPPGLIVLDLMMPIMNGYLFLDEVMKVSAWETIPVLVLSADGQSDRRIPRERVKGYMKKPIDLEPFLDLVSKMTARS